MTLQNPRDLHEESDVGLAVSVSIGCVKAWPRVKQKWSARFPNLFCTMLIKKIISSTLWALPCYFSLQLLSYFLWASIFYLLSYFCGSFFYLQHLTYGSSLVFIILQCLIQNLKKIGNSTKVDLLSSVMKITRIATLWHLRYGFQSTFVLYPS